MKKIIVCALLLCSVVTMMQAQGKQYLGIQVGFTQPITRLNSPSPGKENVLNPTTYNGFKVGFAYDATIVAGFGFLALLVVKIICFFQICGGKAVEPYIIRNLSFLK